MMDVVTEESGGRSLHDTSIPNQWFVADYKDGGS